MTPLLLAITAAIYAVVSGSYFAQGRIGMSAAFFAYAVANVGFIVDALAHRP